MSKPNIEGGTGAGETATGPKVARAASPTIPDSPNDSLLPEDSQFNDDDDDAPIDGASLLDRIHAYTCRFVGYPSRLDSIAHVLWIGHTHLVDASFTTPRLAVLSPEPGSGKSRVLEISGLLVPNPVLSVSSTSAYILRKIADQDNRPTILYDEIDNVLGVNARGNNDLIATINAGYRKGATTGRCKKVKDDLIPMELPTYAALALSGLGDLPDTIMSRSIIIRMRRQPESETVESFDPYDHAASAELLHDELKAWAASVAEQAKSHRPKLPDGIVNRHADVWRPIITLADLAGGHWPDMAREAALAAVKSAKANNKPSQGVQLLTDIRDAFGSKDRISTADLLEKLLADEEAPWGGLGRRGLDARLLAGMLREYGIKSSSTRMPNGSTPKGYQRADFVDAWRRYLPEPATGATTATLDESAGIPETSAVADSPAPPKRGGNEEGVAEPES